MLHIVCKPATVRLIEFAHDPLETNTPTVANDATSINTVDIPSFATIDDIFSYVLPRIYNMFRVL
jgi:hypothetical protein